jgi:RecJ-like exonuclease
MVQTSSMWGLMKRELPTTCEDCHGQGYTVDIPVCEICDGRGLVGNESEVCRSCNGTGKVDSFALIPLALLIPSTHFQRRCEQCGSDFFELRTPVQQKKIYRSWDPVEELREYELVDTVSVACTQCGNAYDIQVDPKYHQPLDPDAAAEFERLGLNLGYMYQPRAQAPSESAEALV